MDAYNSKYKVIAPTPKNNMSYKVYVNPNFNKNTLCHYKVPDSGATYVNTKFSNAVSSVDYKHTISTKIYINPSFIRTSHPHIPVNDQEPTTHLDTVKITNNENLVNNYKQNVKTDSTVKNKSRYSLVRFNKTESANVTVTKKSSNTVRISKHKLVPLNNVKNIIANKNCSGNTTIKNINGSPPIQKYNIIRPTVINMSRSSHKFIKYRPSLASALVANRRDDSGVSRIANEKNKSTMKMKRKVLKKNNIPCPLFKKFGKCIRLNHGHCDFLHDKKHVSICRKFLKGVCHDKDCLLSHDLTVKKMPTCYFYLKGMCNKLDCPYLHIKLSEKSKVCPDFLKGYCEKGKKCLNRHVNISFDTMIRNVNTNKQICTNKYNTQSVNHKYKKNIVQIKYDNNKVKNSEMKQVVESKGCTTEYRYYQELNDGVSPEKEISEVIKPSRCKLGALPSFIQL